MRGSTEWRSSAWSCSSGPTPSSTGTAPCCSVGAAVQSYAPVAGSTEIIQTGKYTDILDIKKKRVHYVLVHSKALNRMNCPIQYIRHMVNIKQKKTNSKIKCNAKNRKTQLSLEQATITKNQWSSIDRTFSSWEHSMFSSHL